MAEINIENQPAPIPELIPFILPGFRFSPTDQQLLGHYLVRKIKGEALEPLLAHTVRQADLYGPNNDPREVYARLNISEHDSEYYFFTYVKKKFETGKGKHINRTAGKGNWKVQNSKTVFDTVSGQEMGYKSTLNFQIANKNLTPSWIMHEYTLPNSENHDHWAICRIKRGSNGKENASSVPSSVCNKNKRPLSSSVGGSVDVDSYHQYGCNKKLRPIHSASPSSNYSVHPQQQPLLLSPLINPRMQAFPASTSYAPAIDTTYLPHQESIDTGQVCLTSEKATLLPPCQISSSTTEVIAEPLGQYCGTSEDDSVKIFLGNEISRSASEGRDDFGEFVDNCADPDFCEIVCEAMDKLINEDEPSTCLPHQNAALHHPQSQEFTDASQEFSSSGPVSTIAAQSTTEVLAELLGQCESSGVWENDCFVDFLANEVFNVDDLFPAENGSGVSSSGDAQHGSDFPHDLENTSFANPLMS